jgi:hypothetical protein
MSNDDIQTDGCWVQFWDDDACKGATLRFDGPAMVYDLDDYYQSNGSKEGDEPDSLRTGSRSWLVVYKDDDYQGRNVGFGPNSQIDDLDDYDMGGNISSFKLTDYRPADFVDAAKGNPTATETDSDGINAETVNNYFRTVVAAALNLIPAVGGALGTLVGGLWPDVGNDEQVWACYQNYINQAVAGVYWQLVYSELNARLQSLFDAAKRYADTPVDEHDSKVVNFNNLFDLVNDDEPYFVDEQAPERKLGFLAPYATLRLAALRENLQNYLYYHGTEPTEEYRQVLTDEIQSLIPKYQGLLDTARDRIVAERKNLVIIEEDGRDLYRVIDLYSGWRGALTDRSEADYHIVQYKERVGNNLTMLLDIHNAIGQLWHWFDPEVTDPVTAPVITYAVGPFGDYQPADAFEQAAGTGRVTQVTLWSGSLVDALQLTVDGVPLGRVGGNGGSEQRLELGDGETIVSANGYATGVINALGFTTSTGRTIYGGQDGGSEYRRFEVLPLVGSEGTELVGLSGYATYGSEATDDIKALTFHWRCSLSIEDPRSGG